MVWMVPGSFELTQSVGGLVVLSNGETHMCELTHSLGFGIVLCAIFVFISAHFLMTARSTTARYSSLIDVNIWCCFDLRRQRFQHHGAVRWLTNAFNDCSELWHMEDLSLVFSMSANSFKLNAIIGLEWLGFVRNMFLGSFNNCLIYNNIK